MFSALHDHPLPVVQWGAVIGASLAAALCDIRERRIPNALTGPLLLMGLAGAWAVGGWPGAADAFLATLVLSLPFVLLFVFAGGGAGDAKLMGAIGAWLGMTQGAIALASVCFSGVVCALVFAFVRGSLRSTSAGVGGIAKTFLHPVFGGGRLRDVPGMLPAIDDGQKMPYGVAIAAGVLIAWMILP